MDIDPPLAVARHRQRQQRYGKEADQSPSPGHDPTRTRDHQMIGVKEQLERERGAERKA